jgi:hypothetical protein
MIVFRGVMNLECDLDKGMETFYLKRAKVRTGVKAESVHSCTQALSGRQRVLNAAVMIGEMAGNFIPVVIFVPQERYSNCGGRAAAGEVENMR